MAGRKIDTGPTGRAVASNVKRLRESAGLRRYTELAERLEHTRPIAPLALRRIEENDRRVDVDDLIALAIALGVSPSTLLIPPATDAFDEVEVTGAGQVTAGRLWSWLRADAPLDGGLKEVIDGNVRLSLHALRAFELRSVPEFVLQAEDDPDDVTDALLELNAAVNGAIATVADTEWDWQDEASREQVVTAIRRAMRNASEQLDDLEAGKIQPKRSHRGDG